LNLSNFDRAINPHTTDFAHEIHTHPMDAILVGSVTSLLSASHTAGKNKHKEHEI